VSGTSIYILVVVVVVVVVVVGARAGGGAMYICSESWLEGEAY
jgi:hypothetical protein